MKYQLFLLAEAYFVDAQNTLIIPKSLLSR